MSILAEPSVIRPRQQHFALLDGLRGLAALLVVLLHAVIPLDLSYLTPHAPLAVDFFFCLSGFVVGYAYEQRLLSTMSLRAFIVARLIRLYPLIAIGTLMGAALFGVQVLVAHQPLTPSFFFGLVCELLLIPNPFPIGLGWRECPPLDPPAWSLFFELLANIVYAVSLPVLRQRLLVLSLAVAAVVLLIHIFVMGEVSGGNYWSNLHGGFIRVAFPFLCGIWLFRRFQARSGTPLTGLANVTPVLLLGVLLFPVLPSVNWVFEAMAVLVLFPVIIEAAASASPGPRLTCLCLFAGRISYPLYILHFPIIKAFSYVARNNQLSGTAVVLLIFTELFTALSFAIIMMRVFDEPVRSWLQRKWVLRQPMSVVLHPSS